MVAALQLILYKTISARENLETWNFRRKTVPLPVDRRSDSNTNTRDIVLSLNPEGGGLSYSFSGTHTVIFPEKKPIIDLLLCYLFELEKRTIYCKAIINQ